MATRSELEAAARRIYAPIRIRPRNKAEEEAELEIERLKQAHYGNDRGYYDGMGVFRVGPEPYYDSNGRLQYDGRTPTRKELEELEDIIQKAEGKKKRFW